MVVSSVGSHVQVTFAAWHSALKKSQPAEADVPYVKYRLDTIHQKRIELSTIDAHLEDNIH